MKTQPIRWMVAPSANYPYNHFSYSTLVDALKVARMLDERRVRIISPTGVALNLAAAELLDA